MLDMRAPNSQLPAQVLQESDTTPQWALDAVTAIIVQWSAGTITQAQAIEQVSDVIVKIATSLNCGNGIDDQGETCDDARNDDGDGCSATCAIEEGWTCDGAPATCTQKISECLDGIDNDHDGHTDALGYKLLSSVNFKMDFPITTFLSSIVHPIIAKNNKYVVAFSTARPSLSVLNIATGALEESLRPLFPTANDDVVDMSGRNYRLMEFQKKVQNGDFVAKVCDPSNAKKVHAVAAYQSDSYALIRVNTGECVALALSSDTGVPWVIETVNGSAISNIVLNSPGGSNVRNPNLHDRILTLGSPGLPPQLKQYNGGILSVASTMLSLPKGTNHQTYTAPMALLVGNADENFNQEFPPLRGLQRWSFGDKLIVGDSVFISFGGGLRYETCTGTICSQSPETEVEGYLVRLDPSLNPIGIRAAKLPAGMSSLNNLTYDKQTNQIFGVMSAHLQTHSIVAFDASTMELMGQVVIDPSLIHIAYNADGSSPRSSSLYISHMAVSDNNLLVFANKGKQTNDLFVYSYSINNLDPNGQKKFVFKKDIGNESAKGGYIGWIPGYALIDNNTLWTTVRTLDPSTLQPIQSYLLRIDPETLSITKEINIPNGVYTAEFGKDVRTIVLNGNWKSNIIEYSTQNPVVTEVPGIVAYTDFRRGILVVMQKDKTFKSIDIATGEITDVKNPLLTKQSAFYPALLSEDGYTTYHAISGQKGLSLATYLMCNP